MKTKGIILTLMASTLVNIPNGFAKNYMSSTELTQSKKVKFELFPVKFSKTKAKECLDLGGQSLLLLTKKPVAILEDFQFQTLEKNQIGIKLVLNLKTNKALEEISKRHINTKLAIVHNGTVLMAPTVKSITTGGALELTFKDPEKFESVLNSLKNG